MSGQMYIIALLYFMLPLSAVASRLQYRVVAEEQHLLIAVCPVHSINTVNKYVQWGSIRPTVYISTCHAPPLMAPLTAHGRYYTLVTEAQTTNGTRNLFHNTTGCSESRWMVELPDYFEQGLGAYCLHVYVQETSVWSGATISGVRTTVWRNRTFPTRAALQFNATEQYIKYSDTDVQRPVPNCIPSYSTYAGAPRWMLLQNTSCTNGSIHYTLTSVHIASVNGIFLVGEVLLYSPDRGITFYQLLLPANVRTLTSFAVSEGRLYAVLARGSNTSCVWVGFEGSSEIVQVYPQPLLARLWTTPSTQWSGLHFDEENELYLVYPTGTTSLPLPIILNAIYHQSQVPSTGQFSVPADTDLHELYSLGHFVLGTWPSCPYLSVLIVAPVCSKFTRSLVLLGQEGAWKWKDKNSLAVQNCSIPANYLPRAIFLGKSQRYDFYVDFVINPVIIDPSMVYYFITMSSPRVITVEVEKSFYSSNNTVGYKMTTSQVSLQEMSSFEGEVVSGYSSAEVDVHFEVWGGKQVCISPCAQSIVPHGDVSTTVYVGCPPGLSLVFDAHKTRQNANQYCQPTTNISCYYFHNDFEPVFEIIDSVAGEHYTYMGSYTLRAVAGGTSLGNMESFQASEKTESELWTPTRDRYDIHKNTIKWVCGTTSPCGELVPDSGGTPEYYLTLEASNSGLNATDTYCALTVQFTIRIHGINMGSVTMAVTITSFVLVLAITTAVNYVLWHYRLKLQYFKDRAIEYCQPHLIRTRRFVTEHVQRCRARMATTQFESK